MSDWPKVRLGDICESISDGDHLPPPKSNEGVPFITISNIGDEGKIDFTNCYHVPHGYYEKIDEKRKPRKGDILYTVVGSFGKASLVDGEKEFCFQRHIAILRPNTNRIVAHYLYSQMRSRAFFSQADAFAIGVAQRTISLSALRRMMVPLPPLDTQRAIAERLAAYDNLIENNKRRIALLEKKAEGLYKEWFVRYRFPGHEKAKWVGDLPEGWKVERLGEICELKNGYAFQSSTFSEKGNFSIATIKNVQDGRFDGSRSDKIVSCPINMPSWCKLNVGDILLSLTGNVGRICMIYEDNFLLNQRVAKIISKYPFYTYWLFKSDEIFSSLNRISYGTAQLNLSPIKAVKQKIIVPCEIIRKRFDEIVSRLFSLKANLQKQNALLAKKRDLLLPRLMSGRMPPAEQGAAKPEQGAAKPGECIAEAMLQNRKTEGMHRQR